MTVALSFNFVSLPENIVFFAIVHREKMEIGGGENNTHATPFVPPVW